jgi:hypothetical protein
VKNDRRFDRRFSPPAKFGSVVPAAVIGTKAGAGAGLRLLETAAASSSNAMGTGEGFREAMGDDDEGSG